MNSERSSESTFRRVHAQTSPRSARAWSMRKPPACHWRAVPCVTIIDFSLKRKGDGAAVMRTRRSKDQRAQAPHCFQHAGTATDRDDAFSRHSGRAGAGALLAGLFLRLEHLELIFVDGWADWSIDRFWVRSCRKAGILLRQSRADCGKQAFEMILRKS